MVNLEFFGWGFSRYRQLTVTPPVPAEICFNTNSSSSEAWADTRNRTAAGPPPASTAALTATSASAHGTASRAAGAGAARDLRLEQPAIAFDPVIVEATDVAHPVTVDVGD